MAKLVIIKLNMAEEMMEQIIMDKWIMVKLNMVKPWLKHIQLNKLWLIEHD
jgi:hypothetical protein